jgi:hypothetical protein
VSLCGKASAWRVQTRWRPVTRAAARQSCTRFARLRGRLAGTPPGRVRSELAAPGKRWMECRVRFMPPSREEESMYPQRPRSVRNFILCALAASATAALSAPVNDDIANAIAIESTGAALNVPLADATLSPADPSCGTATHQSVWYRYTSPVDQFVQARVGPTTVATPLRPRLAVWGGVPGALTPVQCHPDAHEVQFDAAVGATYYVQVYSPQPGGLTAVNLNFNPRAFVNPWMPVPPANDLFWYPVDIPAVPWSTTDRVGAATGDYPGDPFTPCTTSGGVTICTPYGDTLWYRYTTTTTQELDVLFTSAFPGPVVQVMTGTLDQPTLVANSRTPGKSKPGATRFTTQPGVTYMIEFGGGFENTSDMPATLALRPSPPVNPGSVSAARADRIFHRWVWTDPFFEKRTYVVVGVNVTCSRPVPSIEVGFTIVQGPAQGSGAGTVPCVGGRGSGTIEALVSNDFKPGAASVALSATDYDSNYHQTSAPAPVVLRLALGP